MIYFDNNATTRPLPAVVEAMLPFLQEQYANPSSLHPFGQAARHALECARVQVAELIGASPREIVFTSGGTESINLAIRGGLCMRPERRRLVTTAVEHSSVLRVAERATAEGYEVEYVGVDGQGRVDEEQWDAALTDDTAVASLLHANNETGVIFDVPRLAAVAAERGILVHVDAVQSAGKEPIEVGGWPVHLLSLAAHKFHGPKGAGALYVRRRTHIEPLVAGGGQERQLRGGTENVAAIVGMGVAAEIARSGAAQTARGVGALRDALEHGILAEVPAAKVNGQGAPRLYNTSNISFEGLEAEAILILLGEAGVCASSGSACSSGSLEPSHVLRAMGVDPRYAHGAIRFSLSRLSTQDDVERVVALMPQIVSRLSLLGVAPTEKASVP